MIGKRKYNERTHRGSGKTQLANPSGLTEMRRTNPIVARENAPNEPIAAHEKAPSEPNRGSRKGAERTQSPQTQTRRKCAERTHVSEPPPAAERDESKPFLASRFSELVACQRDRTTKVFLRNEANCLLSVVSCPSSLAPSELETVAAPIGMNEANAAHKNVKTEPGTGGGAGRRIQRTNPPGLAENARNEPEWPVVSGPLTVAGCMAHAVARLRAARLVRGGWHSKKRVPRPASGSLPAAEESQSGFAIRTTMQLHALIKLKPPAHRSVLPPAEA